MEKIPAYILSGGKSSRFGSDKARALIDGRPLICRIAEKLQSVAAQITVVADRAGKYDDLGLPTIADEIPELGPIGGLKTALRHAGADTWLLLTSCDIVEIDPAWVALLDDAKKNAAHAVAFKGERWEPLFALYHASIAAIVDAQIRDKDTAMWRLLEKARAAALPLPENWPALLQVNTPQQLAEYMQKRKS